MGLSDRVAVHHLCVFGELAPAYRNERVNPYRLEAQTLEESKPQDGIATHDTRHKHLLVVDFENLDDDVCCQNHPQHSAGRRDRLECNKKCALDGNGWRRLPQRHLIVVLLELVAQHFHFGLPQVHFLRDVHDPRVQTRAAHALVRTMLSRLPSPGLFLLGSHDLGVLEFQ